MDMSDKTIKITSMAVNDIEQKTECEVAVFQNISEGVQMKVGDFNLPISMNYQDTNDPNLQIKLVEILEEIPDGL